MSSNKSDHLRTSNIILGHVVVSVRFDGEYYALSASGGGGAAHGVQSAAHQRRCHSDDFGLVFHAAGPNIGVKRIGEGI